MNWQQYGALVLRFIIATIFSHLMILILGLFWSGQLWELPSPDGYFWIFVKYGSHGRCLGSAEAESHAKFQNDVRILVILIPNILKDLWWVVRTDSSSKLSNFKDYDLSYHLAPPFHHCGLVAEFLQSWESWKLARYSFVKAGGHSPPVYLLFGAVYGTDIGSQGYNFGV